MPKRCGHFFPAVFCFVFGVGFEMADTGTDRATHFAGERRASGAGRSEARCRAWEEAQAVSEPREESEERDEGEADGKNIDVQILHLTA